MDIVLSVLVLFAVALISGCLNYDQDEILVRGHHYLLIFCLYP